MKPCRTNQVIAATARVTILCSLLAGASLFSRPAVAQTVPAANVSAGGFGANAGNGGYSFPANVNVGANLNVASLTIVGGPASNPIFGSGLDTALDLWPSGRQPYVFQWHTG